MARAVDIPIVLRLVLRVAPRQVVSRDPDVVDIVDIVDAFVIDMLLKLIHVVRTHLAEEVVRQVRSDWPVHLLSLDDP